MADDEKEYTIAASEALMIDYCNFVTTPLNSDNDNEKEEALPSAAVATNDTGIDEAVDTIGDPLLMLFFRTLHKESDRLYTEKQRLLKLPLPLMVAATLSDLATAGEATPDVRNTLFHRLQRVWMEKQHELFSQPKPRRRLQKNRAHQIRYFEWSPTLLLSLQPLSLQNHCGTGTNQVEEVPVMVASDDQRTTNDTGTSATAGTVGTAGCRISTFSAPNYIAESFKMHLIGRRDELMEQASLAQQQLFLLEATAVAKRNKSAKRQSQSHSNCDRTNLTLEPQLVNTDTLDTDMDSNQQDSTDDDDSNQQESTDDDDDDAKNGNGNIDLAVAHNTGNNHCNENLSFCSQLLTKENGDWKEVHVRRKVPATGIRTDEEVDNAIYDVPSNSVYGIGSVNATNVVQISNTESVDSEIVDYDQNSLINKLEDTPQVPMPMLLDTIKDLKMQLQQMHQQRIAEQQSAQKALQHERDVSYERIQALQLRLYISETRLQTYEEALQHHVESVHQNIATTPTSIKDPAGNVVATMVNMHATQPEIDLSAVGTPLYARRTTGETKTNRLIISDG